MALDTKSMTGPFLLNQVKEHPQILLGGTSLNDDVSCDKKGHNFTGAILTELLPLIQKFLSRQYVLNEM